MYIGQLENTYLAFKTTFDALMTDNQYQIDSQARFEANSDLRTESQTA